MDPKLTQFEPNSIIYTDVVSYVQLTGSLLAWLLQHPPAGPPLSPPPRKLFPPVELCVLLVLTVVAASSSLWACSFSVMSASPLYASIPPSPLTVTTPTQQL